MAADQLAPSAVPEPQLGAPGGATAARVDGTDGQGRWWAALLLLVTVVGIIVVDLVLYRRSQPDLGSGAVDQPSWDLVGALAAVSVLGLGVLTWRPARSKNLMAPFVVSVVVVTNVAIWPAVWFVEGVPVPAYLRHAPAAATRQAWSALSRASSNGTCATVRHDPTGLLPTPYERCAYRGYGGPPEVEYLVDWNSLPRYGFVFTSGVPAAGGSCVRHVLGDWWAEVTTHTVGPSWLQWNLGDGVVCPASFEYQPI